MGAEKTVRRFLSGTSERAYTFRRPVPTAREPGFEKRVRGSHHLFRRSGVEEKINLQKAGAQAKPYQVKHERAITES